MPDELPFNSPSFRQEAFMARHNITHGPDTDYYDAMHAINGFVRARRSLPPTQKQIDLLKKHGKWCENMDRGQAFDAIKRLP